MASASGDGLVIRQEEVLRAPLSGRFDAFVAEGERVTGRQVVGQVAGEPVIAPHAGVIRYSWDGQEQLWEITRLLDEPRLPGTAAAGVRRQGAGLARRRDGEHVRGGDPVARLVEPFGADLVVWLAQDASGWLPLPGSRSSWTVQGVPARLVTWRLVGKEGMQAEGERVEGQRMAAVVHLQLQGLPPSWMDQRVVHTKVEYTVTTAGRLVPLSALWVRSGRLGVYLRPKTGGIQPIWAPVELVAVWSPRDQVAITRGQAEVPAWLDRLAEASFGMPDQRPGPEAWQRREEAWRRLHGWLVYGPASSSGAGGEQAGARQRGETGVPADLAGKPLDGPVAAWLGLQDGVAAVEGLPAGARVVTNPGWVMR